MGVKKNYSKVRFLKKSFSLIEILVVIGLISLFIPAIFSIIYLIANHETNLNSLTNIKREAKLIIEKLRTTLTAQNYQIFPGLPGLTEEICLSEDSTERVVSYLIDEKGNWLRFCLTSSLAGCDGQQGFVASESSALENLIALNSSETIVKDFQISCLKQNRFSEPILKINFRICSKPCLDEYFFSTKIKMNTL